MAKIYKPTFKQVANKSLRVIEVEIIETDQFVEGVPIVDAEPPAAEEIVENPHGVKAEEEDDKPTIFSVYRSSGGEILKW